MKRMIVVGITEKYSWKITCRSIDSSDVVQVHTFDNCHNHSLDDVASSQPSVRANCASLVIDELIRSIPDYIPRQICKDFIRQHGMRFSFS